MKSRHRVFLLVFLSVLWFPMAHAAEDYVPGELLVQFRAVAGKAVQQRDRLRSRLRASLVRKMPSLGVEHWRLPAGLSVPEAIRQLQGDPAVEYAEPNYRRWPSRIPSDPDFLSQWGLQNLGQRIYDPNIAGGFVGTPGADMRLPSAWNIQTGSSNVVVAVVDDSIDIQHPDLYANIWTNIQELYGMPGVDDDGNGFIDDIHGWDFKNGDNDPSADPGRGEGHGTAVAGCIGAMANNGLGVVGVNWQVSIMPLKFAFDVASMIRAFDYAIRNGANIVNASYGGLFPSRAEEDAIIRLWNAGILLVTAAGNSDTNNDDIPNYPASYGEPNILAVAASSYDDRLSYWSQFGPTTVDLAAPGVSIYTTQSPYGNMGHSGLSGVYYDFIDGTSFSSPYVAGIAALLKAQYPTATYQELKGRILASVTQLTSLQTYVASGGRADAAAALLAVPQPMLLIGAVTWNDLYTGNGDSIPDPGETASLEVRLDNAWADATGVSAVLTPLGTNLIANYSFASYPNIPSGGSQMASFSVTAAPNAMGHQYYAFRLDIVAAGGYAASRFYRVGRGRLESGVSYNATIGTNEQDDYQLFFIRVPVGTTKLTVSTSALQDIDLMLTDNAIPAFDFSTYWSVFPPRGTIMDASVSGNASLTVVNPKPGFYTATVLNPTLALVNYTIQATVNTPGTVLALATGGSVTISASGQGISNTSASMAAGNLPGGVTFPFGSIAYTTTAPVGGVQAITLTFANPLPTGLQLYKVDGAGNYTLIPPGVGADQWSQNTVDSITLSLRDGGPYDADGKINGSIIDPLAIGVVSSTATPTANATPAGGGGGGCMLASRRGMFDPLFPLLLLWAWFVLRGRERLTRD